MLKLCGLGQYRLLEIKLRTLVSYISFLQFLQQSSIFQLNYKLGLSWLACAVLSLQYVYH
jgi:hypothetical protein